MTATTENKANPKWTTTSMDKNVGKPELHTLLAGREYGAAMPKTVWQFFKGFNLKSSHRQQNHSRGRIQVRENCICTHTPTATSIFNRWKGGNHPNILQLIGV